MHYYQASLSVGPQVCGTCCTAADWLLPKSERLHAGCCGRWALSISSLRCKSEPVMRRDEDVLPKNWVPQTLSMQHSCAATVNVLLGL